MLKSLRPFVAYIIILSITFVIVCNPLVTPAQTRLRPDPRGLNRYTLTGETAPLSIFTIPAYNPRDPEFFEGWGRMTAEDLGLEGAEFWNEFGRSARKGILEGRAIIRFPNGFQWDEAYLEGCLKSGKTYFNRIKLVRKPTVKPPPIVKELCVNIPLALEDVPTDWTKTRRPDGKTECNYPVPEPIEVPGPTVTVDNTCKPGASTRILDHHDKKGFNPAEIIRQKLDAKFQERILSLMVIPETTSKVTSLIIYSNGCDYAVWAESVVKKGLGWWKWVIPIAIAGAFLLGYYLRPKCNNCGTRITPIKSTPTSGSPVPIRRRIIPL